MTQAGSSWRYIGRPVRRSEDVRLLTGRGRFTDDHARPGEVWAAFVRSPHAHAGIRGIDTAAACALPGVLAVYTGASLPAHEPGVIDHSPLPSTRDDLVLQPTGGTLFAGPHRLLPDDRTRHAGEAVAMVVAGTAAEAADAAERVELDLVPLPAVVDSVHAEGSDPLWPERPDNVCVDGWHGDRAATEAALADAAHVFTLRSHVQRVTGVPLEPRAAIAEYDDGHYTLVAGSGGAVRQRREIAAALGIDVEKLRVISPDVGGNFGTRNRVYVEFALVLLAARAIGRPVRYVATRSESFLSDYQGRDLATEVTLGLDENGRFMALRADNTSNLGARAVSLSPLGKGSALVTGSYRVEHACVRARAVFSNTPPTQAYRSSGRPEVNFVLERLIDRAAHALGMDRVELRRRNLVTPAAMPYRNAVGALYDSGDYPRALDEALRLGDWNGYDARRRDSAERGLWRGRGLAHYVESSIGTPRERADLHVAPNGVVTLVIGTAPTGQGQATSFAQVVADLMQVDFEQVRVVTGDTREVSAGGGSHSGRSMRHAGAVIGLGVAALVTTGREIVAAAHGIETDAVHHEDGLFRIDSRNVAFGWAEVASLVDDPAHRARWPRGFFVRTDNEMPTPVFPNGCAVCEVEVDPETGMVDLVRYAAVDDVGRAINPLILHGQAHGSIAQGVGQALMEQVVCDPETAQPLTGSLMDYALPRADSLPAFDTSIMEVHSPTNPLGIKSGGEGATTPALAVVVNAVVDALSHLGIDHIEMPLTSERVFRTIRDATHRRETA